MLHRSRVILTVLVGISTTLYHIERVSSLTSSNNQRNQFSVTNHHHPIDLQNKRQIFEQQSAPLLSNHDDESVLSRRKVLGNTFKNFILGTIGASLSTNIMVPTEMVHAADDITTSATGNNGLESVYFGVGCFWHIQHEFIVAEKVMLNRKDNELTSKTGYAGGTQTDKEGRVCYHNLMGVADYGKYGHGEVVGMDLPTDMIVDFTSVYFSLYDPKTKDRVDPQDRGGEYRSLIGLPGGMNHPLYPSIESVATKAGFTLELGKGNDPDTLRKQLVYVYDTNKFPFYQGEVYHQYHDDFQSPPYGRTYNKLADAAYADGRIQTTGCPDRV